MRKVYMTQMLIRVVWFWCCLCYSYGFDEEISRPHNREDSLTKSPSRLRVCYYTTWARYRPPPVNMQPHHVDPHLCTHIIIAFAWITSDGRLALHSEWEDQYILKGLISRRFLNPDMKLLVAVGGWNFGSEPFRRVISSAESIAKFVNSTVSFLEKWDLDGLDLDWEYPEWKDRDMFTLLFRELNLAFVAAGDGRQGEKYLLTAAVPSARDRLAGYDVLLIKDCLDFINLMTYDLHGPWEYKTGHNAALYSKDSHNVVEAARMWAELGMPKKKIIIGMPTYGHVFRLNASTSHALDAAASNGDPGRFTKTHGFYAFYEVCEFLKKEGTAAVWDYQGAVPFAYNDHTWISFDDIYSLRKKVQWLIAEGYGGAMVWELSMDDFTGRFCDMSSDSAAQTELVQFPLLRSINEAMGFDSLPHVLPPSILNNMEKIDHHDSANKHANFGSTVHVDEPEDDRKLDNQCDFVKPKRKDCGHFYTCSRGIQYEFQCPDGTQFSGERGECVWPYEAPECNILITKPTTTTSTTTTTTTIPTTTTTSTTTTTTTATTSTSSTTTTPTTTTTTTAPTTTTTTTTEATTTSSIPPGPYTTTMGPITIHPADPSVTFPLSISTRKPASTTVSNKKAKDTFIDENRDWMPLIGSAVTKRKSPQRKA